MPTENTAAVAATTGTAVAQKSPKRTFQELIDGDEFKRQISLALPKHLTPERFLRVLMNATVKNPQLLSCTQESLFKGIFDCAALGLEIDGRRAHLIPLKNRKKAGEPLEANLWLDYRGIAELVMRSGLVSTIHADLVCENDIFEYDRGELKAHKIDFKAPRGEMYAAYCIIKMKDGTEKVEVMGKAEIERVRNASPGRDQDPWKIHFGEMSKKTVFKRASKWVPLSSEVRGALESDNEPDDPLDVTPKPSLVSLLGDPEPEAPKSNDAPPLTVETTSEAPPAVVVPDRQTTIDLLENAMLNAKVTEAEAVKLAIEKGWAPKKTKELADIDTIGLDHLRKNYSTPVQPADAKA